MKQEAVQSKRSALSPESHLGQFIPMHYHFQMLQDQSRMLGFKEAIRYAVPDGGNVLELGGGTGVLSFFAAERAAHVWCVERLPALAAKARELLAINPHAAQVEVITGDSDDYLPPQAVDTVICEMLHSALLREKQVQVIASFVERYTAHFGPVLPNFIPAMTILSVEPVYIDFNFHGFHAPLPIFQTHAETPATVSLGSPVAYAMVEYKRPLPTVLAADLSLRLTQSATLNALRFFTDNVLASGGSLQKPIHWFNQHLILPLATWLPVSAQDVIRIRFSYQPGDEIETLMGRIRVSLDHDD